MKAIVVLALLAGAVVAGVTGTARGSTHAARPLGRTDSAPMDFAVSAPASVTVGAGEPFTWEPTFSDCAAASSGGQCPSITTGPSLVWSTTLPAGVTMLHAGLPGRPGVLDDCVSNCSYTFSSGGASDQGYDYTLVAPAPGDYSLAVTITSTSQPDPDTTNDTATTSLHVVPLSLKLKSTSARAARAGKRFVWTLELLSLVTGADVQPTKVSCLGHIGKKAVRGKPTIARGDHAGELACAWRIPSKTASKRLATQVKASLAGANASLSGAFRIRT